MRVNELAPEKIPTLRSILIYHIMVLSSMGILKKLKKTGEKAVDKGAELGRKGIEKGAELGTRGYEGAKDAAQKGHDKAMKKKVRR
ncbi:MAG: hypothetical protein HMLIMOIP_001855 [Candidatus Nitrosomirales archaeon]|jgi:hypothetical protein